MQKIRYPVQRTKTRVDWYELFYLEDQGYILVFKEPEQKKHRYLIRVRKVENEMLLDCECQGAFWKNQCHHVDNAMKNFNFNRISRPRNINNKATEDVMKTYLTGYLIKRGRKTGTSCAA